MKLEYALIIIDSFFRVHLCILSNIKTKVESLDVLQHLLCIFIVLGLMTKVATTKIQRPTQKKKILSRWRSGEGLLKPQKALTTYIGIQFTIVDDVEKIN